MELLRTYIKQCIPRFSEEAMEQFLNLFELKTIPKKDYLLKQGRYARYEGFVSSGCFRVFNLDTHGDEHTLYFAIQNWWVGDINSFINNIPAQLNIQAIKNSEVLLITKENKEKAFAEIPEVEKLFRIIFQRALIAQNQRILRYNSISAEERYYYFIKNYGDIIPLVSNRQIASYLGVTPEFISRIKRKNSKTS